MNTKLTLAIILALVFCGSVFSGQLVAKEGAVLTEILEETQQLHHAREWDYQKAYPNFLRMMIDDGCAVILRPGAVIEHVGSFYNAQFKDDKPFTAVAVRVPGDPEVRYSARYYFE